jgi:photosystem II stability/assembly factor-like uncharacterized protein
MNKRIYLAILFAGIIGTGIGQTQWDIEKCPAKNNLNAISFVDLSTGWIVGENGTILYRSGGEWKEYQEFTSRNLNSVFMLDKNDGWAVGENGIIIHFNGKTWESFDSPTKNDLFSVSFQDSEKGVAVGDFGTILIYKNGVWNLIESGIRGTFFSVSFRKDEAWIGGGLECNNIPLIKMGLNKNDNSFIYPSDPLATIKSIIFMGQTDGWAAGSPSILLHFDGDQWNRANTNDDYSSLNSIFFSEENNGISAGYGGTVLIFSDNLWVKQKTITSQNLNGATIIKNNYFAVGDSGTIIHMDLTSDNIETDFSKNNQGKIQVYPNPCDDFLNIVIPCDYDDLAVTVSVRNLSGEIIMQKELRSRTISLTYPLITKDFVNGLYLVSTTIGDKTTSNKFIVRH